MATVAYTNRKGCEYFLCAGRTKHGKIRYFFAREPGTAPVRAIPEGYEIQESINGVVSLAKARPKLILDAEVDAVKAALAKHPRGRRYRVDAQGDSITVYQSVGVDLGQIQDFLVQRTGFITGPSNHRDFEAKHARYMAMLRFVLMAGRMRKFFAQRMCFRLSVDSWILVSSPKSLVKLAGELIPALGTDAYYELC